MKKRPTVQKEKERKLWRRKLESLGLPFSWESPGCWASLELGWCGHRGALRALLRLWAFPPGWASGCTRYLGTNDRDPPDRHRELGRLFNVRGGRDRKEVVQGARRGGRGPRGRSDSVPSSRVRGGPVYNSRREGSQGVQCGLQGQAPVVKFGA